MRGERRIWMGRYLLAQSGRVRGPNQPGPSGTRSGPMRAPLKPLAPPTSNRGWIDPEHGGDVTHAMTGIHRGQGSFTDVV